MTEVPSNKWPVNQVALEWLQKAKEPARPQTSYLAQLAWWGLETGALAVADPLSPSQPERADLESVLGLLLGSGPAKAKAATTWFLENPNLDRWEQEQDLVRQLQAAEDPVEAARVVLEAAYDLMVATTA
jgi:hypothetical protein